MSDKIKLSIIGVGHMGQYHVNVAKMVADAKLVGVYDADSERCKQIAERHETKAFSDLDEILSESEAVVIAVPTFLHYEVAKKALLAKKHVLVEKPISETVEQAKELVNLAKDNQLIFQVGHVERFNGAVLELNKIAEQPLLVEFRRLSPYNARIKDVGVVLDMMIHDIDIVMNLVNSDVVSVSALGSSVYSKHEDIATVIIKFANGCIAKITASRCTQAKIRTLNISQKETYIELDFADQEIQLHRQASSNTSLGKDVIRYKQESIVEKIFVHKDNPLKQEQEHFIRCIMGKDTPFVEGDKDIKTLEIAHEILRQIHKT